MKTKSKNFECRPWAVEFELDGYKHLRFFDLDGNLYVSGPMETKEAQSRYLAKYAPLCRSQSLREFLTLIRPETDMSQKLHAILHLMEEHKDDIAQGMGISADLVMAVLDSCAPWQPMDLETWAQINSLES